MCFVCSGRKRNTFELLYQEVSSSDDVFIFYESGLSLLKDLICKNISADLLLLEYSLYQGFSDFFYDVLLAKNMKIPIILIGNPFLKRKSLAQRWISENELYYDVQTFHTLRHILQRITEALGLEMIHRLFFEEAAESSAPKKANLVEIIRKKTALTPVVSNLLNFFYKNRRREISIREIENLLHIAAKSEKIRKNVVYAYISKLRKCVETVSFCSIEIVRTRKGFYQLIENREE